MLPRIITKSIAFTSLVLGLALQSTLLQAQPPGPGPVILDISDDLGSLMVPFTSDTTLVIDGDLAALGDTVTIFDVTAGGSASLGTTVADGITGAWSFTTPALTEEYHDLYAQDSVGASFPVGVTIDLTAPAAPVITGFTDDTGTPGDDITSDTTPTLIGTTEAFAGVEVLSGVITVGVTAADVTGGWSLTISALADGSYSYTAEATDLAGNTGPASAAQNITIDTSVPPGPPTITGFTTDSGTLGDGITNDNTPTVSGTGSNNVTVDIYNGLNFLGSTTSDGSGNWSLTAAPALPDDNYLISAVTAGQTSAVSLALTIDTAAPAAPVITGYTAGTNTLAGTSEANASVEVLSGVISVGVTSANGSGNWSLGLGSLAAGNYSLTAEATDAAGNTGPASGAQAVTVTASTPSTPETQDPVTDISAFDVFYTGDFAIILVTAESRVQAIASFNSGKTRNGSISQIDSTSWEISVPFTPGEAATVTIEYANSDLRFRSQAETVRLSNPIQFTEVTKEELKKLTPNTIGGFTRNNLLDIDPAEILALDDCEYSLFLTSLIDPSITPADISRFLKDGWDINLQTGELTIPDDADLCFGGFENENTDFFPPDLSKGPGLGGDALFTMQQCIDDALVSANFGEYGLIQGPDGVVQLLSPPPGFQVIGEYLPATMKKLSGSFKAGVKLNKNKHPVLTCEQGYEVTFIPFIAGGTQFQTMTSQGGGTTLTVGGNSLSGTLNPLKYRCDLKPGTSLNDKGQVILSDGEYCQVLNPDDTTSNPLVGCAGGLVKVGSVCMDQSTFDIGGAVTANEAFSKVVVELLLDSAPVATRTSGALTAGSSFAFSFTDQSNNDYLVKATAYQDHDEPCFCDEGDTACVCPAASETAVDIETVEVSSENTGLELPLGASPLTFSGLLTINGSFSKVTVGAFSGNQEVKSVTLDDFENGSNKAFTISDVVAGDYVIKADGYGAGSSQLILELLDLDGMRTNGEPLLDNPYVGFSFVIDEQTYQIRTNDPVQTTYQDLLNGFKAAVSASSELSALNIQFSLGDSFSAINSRDGNAYDGTELVMTYAGTGTLGSGGWIVDGALPPDSNVHTTQEVRTSPSEVIATVSSESLSASKSDLALTLDGPGGSGSAGNEDEEEPAPVKSKLAFVNQPAEWIAGQAGTQPSVAIQDSNSEQTTDTDTIYLAIKAGTGTPGAVLTCADKAAVDGLASFVNCHIDKAGTGYVLTATATGLTSADSRPFEVKSRPLSFTTQPARSAVTKDSITITFKASGTGDNACIVAQKSGLGAILPSVEGVVNGTAQGTQGTPAACTATTGADQTLAVTGLESGTVYNVYVALENSEVLSTRSAISTIETFVISGSISILGEYGSLLVGATNSETNETTCTLWSDNDTVKNFVADGGCTILDPAGLGTTVSYSLEVPVGTYNVTAFAFTDDGNPRLSDPQDNRTKADVTKSASGADLLLGETISISGTVTVWTTGVDTAELVLRKNGETTETTSTVNITSEVCIAYRRGNCTQTESQNFRGQAIDFDFSDLPKDGEYSITAIVGDTSFTTEETYSETNDSVGIIVGSPDYTVSGAVTVNESFTDITIVALSGDEVVASDEVGASTAVSTKTFTLTLPAGESYSIQARGKKGGALGNTTNSDSTTASAAAEDLVLTLGEPPVTLSGSITLKQTLTEIRVIPVQGTSELEATTIEGGTVGQSVSFSLENVPAAVDSLKVVGYTGTDEKVVNDTVTASIGEADSAIELTLGLFTVTVQGTVTSTNNFNGAGGGTFEPIYLQVTYWKANGVSLVETQAASFSCDDIPGTLSFENTLSSDYVSISLEIRAEYCGQGSTLFSNQPIDLSASEPVVITDSDGNHTLTLNFSGQPIPPAQKGTTTTVADTLPTIAAGTAGASLATVTIKENTADSLNANGQFRMVLPSGVSFAADGHQVTNGTVIGRFTTFSSNDTLVLAPTATSGIDTFTVTAAVNTDPSATDGNVTVNIIDGDTAAANGAGVIGGTETVARVGETDSTIAVSGSVSGVSSQSYSRVVVKLLDENQSLVKEVDATSANGGYAFAFDDLDDGTYYLTAEGYGDPATNKIAASSITQANTGASNSLTLAATQSQVDLGVSSVSGNAFNATVSASISGAGLNATFSSTDSIDIYATINPDPSHVGAEGAIVVIAGLDQGGGTLWYENTQSGWIPWDGTNFQFWKSVDSLGESMTFEVFNGLNGLAGSFTVFVGYKTGNEIIYNTTPITFTVE